MSADKTPQADGANANGEAAPPKSGKKKLVFIGIGVAVLLIVGGAGAYFAGVFGEDAPPPEAEGEHVEAAPPPPAEPTYWSAPDLVVTLNTGERRTRYLKLRTTLELASPGDVAKVEEFTPRLVDYCQIYLRELRPEELRGSAAIVRLREDLLRRINLAVAPVVVRNVYFTDIFVE
jgi:Flagellar basal body-associated protein